MRVRKINPVTGRQFGGGLQSFWVDVPDGVGQCIITRLKLWQGQWFLNLPDGTRWLTNVLGKYTGNTADVEVRDRVLGTTGVVEIVNYSSSLDRNTRKWAVNMLVQTLYGQVQISGYLPGPTPAAGIGEFSIGGSPIGNGGLG